MEEMVMEYKEEDTDKDQQHMIARASRVAEWAESVPLLVVVELPNKVDLVKM